MVKLVINSGPNVPPALIAHYELEVLPVRIVVDGVEHEIADVQHTDVDDWVARAEQFPFLLGTSAAEFAARFVELGRDDPDLLAVMTSRKLMQSHDAARAARRTLDRTGRGEGLSIGVVDTAATDVASALAVIYAAEARAAGHSREQLEVLCGEFARRTQSVFALRTLDNITKGGRASFLKTWLAKVLHVRPLLSFVDGEIASVGRYSADGDPVDALVDWLSQRPALRTAEAAWVAIAHGGCIDDAARLLGRIGELVDVRYALVRPLVPSVYLHGGPHSLLVSVTPLDELPWSPSTPPT